MSPTGMKGVTSKQITNQIFKSFHPQLITYILSFTNGEKG